MPAACFNRAAESLRLAQVLRGALPGYPWRLSPHQWKVLNAILRCGTPELGGHLYHCADCGGGHFVPHSCRNRHCPQCQKAQCIQWLEKQSQALLPVPYFHVVFTLPHDLNALIAQNQTAIYNLLFAAASATLLKFGEHRLKAQIGVTAVLHTWSQTLLDHYHLHCVVTGGGLGARGWKRASEHYLFPVKALSNVFKAKFLQGLREIDRAGKLAFHGSLEALREKTGFAALLARAARSRWVVYTKAPFAGPKAVLAYLSRYTHRVAIGNKRLLKLDPSNQTVTFAYKDYADHARPKTMTLSVVEFARRFCLHILPNRFVKIRHFGFLSNRDRTASIEAARALLNDTGLQQEQDLRQQSADLSAGLPPLTCPHCGSLRLRLIQICPPIPANSS